MDTLGYGANIALAIVLLGSGALKLGREGRAAFAASAPAALVVKLAPRFASAFRASVVIVEAGVAIALLASSSVAAEVVAAVLFVSMAIVLSISKHVAPTKPCGCAGTLSVEVNVSRSRSLVRLAALVGVSLAAVCATALIPSTGAAEILIGFAVTCSIVVAVSRELRPDVLVPRLTALVWHGSARGSLFLLRRSYSWRSLSPYLLDALPEDHWTDSGWEFFQWSAQSDESVGSIVFALRRTAREVRILGTFLGPFSDGVPPRIVARVHG